MPRWTILSEKRVKLNLTGLIAGDEPAKEIEIKIAKEARKREDCGVSGAKRIWRSKN